MNKLLALLAIWLALVFPAQAFAQYAQLPVTGTLTGLQAVTDINTNFTAMFAGAPCGSSTTALGATATGFFCQTLSSGGSLALAVSTSNVSYSGVLSAVTSSASLSTVYSGASYTYNPSTKVFDIASGGTYEIGGTQIAASNLSNGVTGTGDVVLQTTPTLTTPVIGAATGTSLGMTSTTATAPVNGIYSSVANELDLTTSSNKGLQITSTGNVPEVYTSGAFVSGPNALTISTATFTPVSVGSNTFRVVLVHASCPCTIANPSGSAVDGERFILEVWQSSTGSDTIGTWGSNYDFGTAGAPTLSTGASKGDFLGFSYSSQNSKFNYIGSQLGM